VGGKTFTILCLWNKISNNNRSQTFNPALQCKQSRIEINKVVIQEYDYEIIHRAGKGNTNADTLSRNPITD